MDRRTLIAGTVTLPLLPAAGTVAQPANATDAAWAEYQAAKAAYEDWEAAHAAWEVANLPPRLQRSACPKSADFTASGWRAAWHAWTRERDAIQNPHDLDDDQLDALCDPMNEAREAILKTPAATVTDVERKLSIVAGLAHDNQIEAEWIESVLADVRRINGRAA